MRERACPCACLGSASPLLALPEKTKETESQLGSPHPGKFLDGSRNKISRSSADERARVVIRSTPLGSWHSPVARCSPSHRQQPLLPPASLKRKNTDGATCRAGLEPWGGRRLLESKPKLSESSMDLKNHQMHFFVVLFYCKMQPPSMTGNWKLPSPSRPCPESREIKAR